MDFVTSYLSTTYLFYLVLIIEWSLRSRGFHAEDESVKDVRRHGWHHWSTCQTRDSSPPLRTFLYTTVSPSKRRRKPLLKTYLRSTLFNNFFLLIVLCSVSLPMCFRFIIKGVNYKALSKYYHAIIDVRSGSIVFTCTK